MKTIRQGYRAALLMAAAASLLAFASGARAQDRDDDHDSHGRWPYATTDKSPVLAVVGDVSCQPGKEVSSANGSSTTTGEAGHEVCNDANTTKGNYTNTSLWQSQEATANQIEAMKPAAVALLGDLQYQVGQYSDFEGSFDWTYGAFKFLHRPSPGNHEFYDEHGQTGVAGYGYFSYYNGFLVNTTGIGSPVGSPITTTIPDPCPPALAGPCGYSVTNSMPLSAQPIPRADGQAGHFELGASGGALGTGVGDGWYSYNLGSWHLISLNIQCSTQEPGGCPALGSNPAPGTWLDTELKWLEKDLDENHAPCTVAYWHQPTFSATNSIAPEGVTAQLFWQKLYDHRADLVLNGHDHLYARYEHLDPNGIANPEGIREFIVGTGGETLDPIVNATVASGKGETNLEDPTGNTGFNAAHLKAYSGDYWGVMALTLDPNGYHWDFESAPLASPTASFNNGGGPGSGNNGPTLPVAALNPANGLFAYSDKGFGVCHNSPDRDRHDDDRNSGRDDDDHDHDR